MCDDIAIDDMAKSSKMVASGASNGSLINSHHRHSGNVPTAQGSGTLRHSKNLAKKAFGKSMENHGGSSITWVISHVPIFHITQPLGIWSTRWLLFQVMSNSPKNGHLPIPV